MPRCSYQFNEFVITYKEHSNTSQMKHEINDKWWIIYLLGIYYIIKYTGMQMYMLYYVINYHDMIIWLYSLFPDFNINFVFSLNWYVINFII